MDDVHKRLDDLRTDIGGRFDDVSSRFDDVNRRFDDVNRRLDQFALEFRDLRAAMRSHFRWTVTTMVALFGAAVPVWMWVLSLILKVR
jgi:hypothetical protein